MPYFVYKITSPADLAHVDTMHDYKSARSLVRALREGQPPGTGIQFRMVFAKHHAEAEKLLSTPRDERVIGED